jgi:regulator of sigma E protease
MLIAVAATTLILLLSIGIHELGHHLTAKRFGVHVSAFALGMGPVLLRRQFGETEYRLCLLPIGGYVRAARRADVTQGSAGPAIPFARTLEAKPWWQQASVLLAGVCMNVVLVCVALALQSAMQQAPLLELPGITLSRTLELFGSTFAALVEIFSGPRPLDSLSSPVGITVITGEFVQSHGFNGFLAILVAVNISLALFNLLPLPVLDGGQLLMATTESLLRRPLPGRFRHQITMASAALMLGLVATLTLRDVQKHVLPKVTVMVTH